MVTTQPEKEISGVALVIIVYFDPCGRNMEICFYSQMMGEMFN